MTSTITRLVFHPRRHGIVEIHLDDHSIFAIPDTEASCFQPGQPLEEDDLARLQALEQETSAFERALRFLESRPRSRREIESNLSRGRYTAETIAVVLERLQRLGYADDEAFAQWWLANRTQFKPRGAQALRFELRQKGVSGGAVDEAIAELDDAELALTAGQSKAARWQGLDEAEFRKKMFSFLQRRGFAYEIARHATEQLWQQLESDL